MDRTDTSSHWIIGYSLNRINGQWTAADHEELERVLHEIDETAQAILKMHKERYEELLKTLEDLLAHRREFGELSGDQK